MVTSKERGTQIQHRYENNNNACDAAIMFNPAYLVSRDPNSRKSDVMSRGKLLNCDCMEYMSKQPDNKFELTLTDIPYGVVNRKSQGIRKLDKGTADMETFNISAFVMAVCRVTKGSVYIFCGTEQVSEIRKAMIAKGMTTRLCIWEKSNPSPVNGQHMWLSGVECCVYGRYKGTVFNEHCKNTVWRFPTTRSKIHPTQKPVPLFEMIINTSSNQNDVVFDPTAGSGTTGIACQNTGRNFVLCELDREYAKKALIRLRENKEVLSCAAL